MPDSALVNLIRRKAAQRGLDPAAVLAVASQEGLGGGIGDGGHAFGPFQLNDAGGVLTGKFGNLSPEQKNAWAWTPRGLDYALDGIAKVAAGKHGAQAVDAIVRQFERPQNPDREVAGARRAYGLPATATGPGRMTPLASLASLAPRAPSVSGGGSSLTAGQMSALLGANQAVGLSTSPMLAQLFAAKLAGPTAPAAAPQRSQPGLLPAASGGSGFGGSIAELLQEGTGGPTHSTGPHIHLATRNPKSMLAALAEGKRLGLAELENPYVDPVNAAVHAPHSFHKQVFPGLYNGRTLGQATDFSGDPAKTKLFLQWIRSTLK